jgi:hypothetical protein
MILLPKYIALDTATLGGISRDYWSSNSQKRSTARETINLLAESGVYVVVSYTHVNELLRHENESTVRDRLSWLRQLPLVAWLHSYDLNWQLGGMFDIAICELNAIIHGSAKTWVEVAAIVRQTFLKTGTGADIFGESTEFWEMFGKRAQLTQGKQISIASLLRVDIGPVGRLKLKDFDLGSSSKKTNFKTKVREVTGIAQTMAAGILEHGDPRADSQLTSAQFAAGLLKDLEAIEQMDGNICLAIIKHFDIPESAVRQEMTIDQIGQLAVLSQLLTMLGKRLSPPANPTVLTVPPESFPSFAVERELLRHQQNAPRVDGSDLGDCHIVPLALYIDAVEADKRTVDHVRKIRSQSKLIASHLGPVFRCPDYTKLPETLKSLGIIRNRID